MTGPHKHVRTAKEDRDLLRPLHGVAIEKWKSLNGDEAERMAQLPQPWRMLYTTMCLDGEVRNGGFHQFFWNSEGQRDSATLVDLEMIGATDLLNLFKRAVACSTEFRVADTKRHSENTWEEFTAGYKEIPWDNLDREYYETSPNLAQHVARYVREHRSQFIEDA